MSGVEQGNFYLLLVVEPSYCFMDDQTHKAHRPAQSGAKDENKAKAQRKEKQKGFNEKACIGFFDENISLTDSLRPLPRLLVDGQTGRLGETSNVIKLVYTFPS